MGRRMAPSPVSDTNQSEIKDLTSSIKDSDTARLIKTSETKNLTGCFNAAHALDCGLPDVLCSSLLRSL